MDPATEDLIVVKSIHALAVSALTVKQQVILLKIAAKLAIGYAFE
jgi:hypothetical protein